MKHTEGTAEIKIKKQKQKKKLNSAVLCPFSRISTPQGPGNRNKQRKSSQTPHRLDTTSSSFCTLSDVTDHRITKPPHAKIAFFSQTNTLITNLQRTTAKLLLHWSYSYYPCWTNTLQIPKYYSPHKELCYMIHAHCTLGRPGIVLGQPCTLESYILFF